MKQVIVGHYYCGYESIQVVLREGFGGEFFVTPELGSVARVKIGADQDTWGEMLAVFLHELFEFSLVRLGKRFEQDGNIIPKSSSSFLFVMNHEEMHLAVSMVAGCMEDCVPDLGKAWDKWQKKKKKKK